MFDLDQLMTMSSEVVATWTPRVVGALAVLIFGWIFAGWIRSFARKALKRARHGVFGKCVGVIKSRG